MFQWALFFLINFMLVQKINQHNDISQDVESINRRVEVGLNDI